MEAEIEKLLDTLTGANATLLAYANKKIEELDTRRQTISKAIAELSVETIMAQLGYEPNFETEPVEAFFQDHRHHSALLPAGRLRKRLSP